MLTNGTSTTQVTEIATTSEYWEDIEWRCAGCKRLLAKFKYKGKLNGQHIASSEIKCKCNTVNVLKFTG